MDVSVIIISYNTLELTRNCINSVLEKTTDINYEIIVVDNASNDGTVEMIENTFPQVKLLAEKKNWGFGTANNIGAKNAKGDFIFLLNSDTLLVNNAIKILFQYIQNNPDIGICGGQLFDLKMNKTNSYGPYPTLSRELFVALLPAKFTNFKPIHFEKAIKLNNCISGADMMINKKLYDQINGFDTDFFMYSEDVDLSYRMKKIGYNSAFVPEAKIIHLVNQSSYPNENSKNIYNIDKWSYSEEKYSKFIFYQKIFGALFSKTIFWICQMKSYLAIFFFALTIQFDKMRYWRKYNTIHKTQFQRYIQHISQKPKL